MSNQPDNRSRGTDRAELTPRHSRLGPGLCAYCDAHRSDTMMPPHDASRFCESGRHAHCTCDTCY
jgi:hypothetical protein